MKTDIARIIKAFGQGAWAIMPEKIEEIAAMLLTRSRMESPSAEAMTTVHARTRDATMAPESAGAVAVIQVFGTISHRAGMVGNASGGTTVDAVTTAFRRAMADDAVTAIIFDIDSPGGEVSGVPELAAEILEARGTKPITAVANALAASAAYWIASSADEIVATRSAYIGSIGVFTLHEDWSGYLENEGIDVNFISAGKYKVEGNFTEPLQDETRAYVQGNIDHHYTTFVNHVARARGLTAAQVANGYGEGRVLLAHDALAAGLIDRIATLDQVLEDHGIDRGRVRAAAATEPGTGGPVSEHPPTPVTTQTAHEAKEETVDTTTTAAPGGAVQDETPSVVSIETARRDAEAAAKQRASQIMAMAAAHDFADRAAEWVESDMSAADVGVEIARLRRENGQEPVITGTAPTIDLPSREKSEYSLGLVYREILLGKPGLGWEVSEAMSSNLPDGQERQGGYLVDVRNAFRPSAALDTVTATGGAELVFTEAGSFIDLLRNRSVLMRMGATRLPGLQGDVGFPRQTASAIPYWRADNPGSDVPDSDLTLDQPTMTPHILQLSTGYTRQLARQSVEAIDRIVENDILASHALEIDQQGLHGDGTGNALLGLYNYTGVAAVAFGGSVTWPKIVEVEGAAESNNAPIGAGGYANTVGVASAAKTTPKETGTAVFLWEGKVGEGEMNGYDAMASNQFLSNMGVGTDEHGLLFSPNWADLFIGEWGVLELVRDPYSKKKQGLIEITSYQTVDVMPRHPEVFVKATGLIP